MGKGSPDECEPEEKEEEDRQREADAFKRYLFGAIVMI